MSKSIVHKVPKIASSTKPWCGVLLGSKVSDDSGRENLLSKPDQDRPDRVSPTKNGLDTARFKNGPLSNLI